MTDQSADEDISF